MFSVTSLHRLVILDMVNASSPLSRYLTDRIEKRDVLTPAMIRAARALLNLDQGQLAAAAGVSRKTVAVVENIAVANIDARRRTVLEAVRRALEELGIIFIFADETAGEGVRIATPKG